jgi:hypothetical protein
MNRNAFSLFSPQPQHPAQPTPGYPWGGWSQTGVMAKDVVDKALPKIEANSEEINIMFTVDDIRDIPDVP